MNFSHATRGQSQTHVAMRAPGMIAHNLSVLTLKRPTTRWRVHMHRYLTTGTQLGTANPRLTNGNIMIYTVEYRQWSEIRCEGFWRLLCRPASVYSKAEAAETLCPTFALPYLGIHCMSLRARHSAFSTNTAIGGGLELLLWHHHVELVRRAMSGICKTVGPSNTTFCNWISSLSFSY